MGSRGCAGSPGVAAADREGAAHRRARGRSKRRCDVFHDRDLCGPPDGSWRAAGPLGFFGVFGSFSLLRLRGRRHPAGSSPSSSAEPAGRGAVDPGVGLRTLRGAGCRFFGAQRGAAQALHRPALQRDGRAGRVHRRLRQARPVAGERAAADGSIARPGALRRTAGPQRRRWGRPRRSSTRPLARRIANLAGGAPAR